MMFLLSSASVGEVYEEHKDEDGFLYVQYSGENTFGGVAERLWNSDIADRSDVHLSVHCPIHSPLCVYMNNNSCWDVVVCGCSIDK